MSSTKTISEVMKKADILSHMTYNKTSSEIIKLSEYDPTIIKMVDCIEKSFRQKIRKIQEEISEDLTENDKKFLLVSLLREKASVLEADTDLSSERKRELFLNE